MHTKLMVFKEETSFKSDVNIFATIIIFAWNHNVEYNYTNNTCFWRTRRRNHRSFFIGTYLMCWSCKVKQEMHLLFNYSLKVYCTSGLKCLYSLFCYFSIHIYQAFKNSFKNILRCCMVSVGPLINTTLNVSSVLYHDRKIAKCNFESN